MAMAARSATVMLMTDGALLTLAQWLSPAFPLGSFAYSHGLEAAVMDGQVTDRRGAEAWIGDVIAHGSGRADAVLLCAAMAPGADYAALDREAEALAAGAERWEETRAQGQAFTETVNALEGRADETAALPVAVGRAAARLGLPEAQVAALYLQAFASNLALAAVRFIPLGQSEGQAIVHALRPVVLRLAEAAPGLDPAEIVSEVPGADLASLRHETLDVRIFRS